jgi:hypothetical protein
MKVTYVVTTINEPTPAMKALSGLVADAPDSDLVVVLDMKSKPGFKLDANVMEASHVASLDRQLTTHSAENHYARKNIGYLEAMYAGADVIRETDDDNEPLPQFVGWRPDASIDAYTVTDPFLGLDWVNVYEHFQAHGVKVWPRGLPLDRIHSSPCVATGPHPCYAPIQQCVVNGDPDVDAIFRLANPTAVNYQFRQTIPLALRDVWSPFNSQSTEWHKRAFPLMYLPRTCSPRVTDILRSYVAQRIAYSRGWFVSYHSPRMFQDRNAHNLMKDFWDELPLYTNAQRYRELLINVKLPEDTIGNVTGLCNDLFRCYQALVKEGIVTNEEMIHISDWSNAVQWMLS